MTRNRLSRSNTVTLSMPVASRASWVGTLQVGVPKLPAKAYGTVASKTKGRPHPIHPGCGQRIQHHRGTPQAQKGRSRTNRYGLRSQAPINSEAVNLLNGSSSYCP